MKGMVYCIYCGEKVLEADNFAHGYNRSMTQLVSDENTSDEDFAIYTDH